MREAFNQNWDQFLKLCLEIKNEKEFHELLDLFLTIEEKETLASRFAIVKALLNSELTQRQIAETFKVSISQITRGSNALKIVSPELKEHLRNLLHQSP